MQASSSELFLTFVQRIPSHFHYLLSHKMKFRYDLRTTMRTPFLKILFHHIFTVIYVSLLLCLVTYRMFLYIYIYILSMLYSV